MTTEEKLRIKELAAQLREASQTLNYIIKSGERYDLIMSYQIVASISDEIKRVARK